MTETILQVDDSHISRMIIKTIVLDKKPGIHGYVAFQLSIMAVAIFLHSLDTFIGRFSQ